MLFFAPTRSGKGVVVAPLDIVWAARGSETVMRTLASEPFFKALPSRDLEVKGRVTQRVVDRAKALGFRVISGWPGLAVEDH